jgi:hypothetical protein
MDGRRRDVLKLRIRDARWMWSRSSGDLPLHHALKGKLPCDRVH